MERPININETTLLNYFSGSVTSTEKDEIKKWLSSSEKNRKLARDIENLYFATDVLAMMKQTDARASLAIVKKRITKNKRHSFFYWCQKVAAILFIPLLLSTTYYLCKDEPIEYIEYKANPGMITSVDLSDGSKVWLNSGSTLRLPSRFTGKNREVNLSGEAYFQIARDEKRRFIVSSGDNLKVEVLGTKFNIEAYEEDNYIETTLEEGSIRLQYKSPDKMFKSIVMSPNQKVIYSKQTGDTKNLETYVSSDIAWKDRKIILRNTSLEEVLKQLSHRFNVEFKIERDAIRKNSFTGIFDTQQLVQILEHLRISSDIRYRILEPLPGDQTIQAKSKIILY